MELNKLIENTKEILQMKDIQFMDALEELSPKFDLLLTKVNEDQDYVEINKDLLVEILALHKEVLARANLVLDSKSEITANQKKTAKGIKAYIDKYPKRISAFSKRKG